MMQEIKKVFSQNKYKKYFVFLFVVFFILSSFLMVFISFPALFKGEILIVETATLKNFIFLVAFSFLAALSVTLHIFKIKEIKSSLKGRSNIGFVGMIFGFFTSSCSICYPLILTVAGVPAAFAFLPFGGLELQAASIVLLFFSIYLVTKNIHNSGVCKIQ